MTASRRVVRALAVIGIGAVVVAALMVYRLTSIVDDTRRHHTPALAEALSIKGLLGDAIQEVLAYLVTRDAAEWKDAQRAFQKAEDALNAFVRTPHYFNEPGERAEHDQTKRLQKLVAKLRSAAQAMVDSRHPQSNSKHVDPQAFAQFEEGVDQALGSIDQLIALEQAEMNQVHQQTLRANTQARLSIWAVAASVLVLVLGVGLFMRRALAQAEDARAEQRRIRDRFVSQHLELQDEERRRIARELHDEAGQAMSALAVGCRELSESHDVGEMQAIAARLQKTAQGLTHDLSRLVRGLHPPLIDDQGLVPALEHLLREYRGSHGITISLDKIGMSEQMTIAPKHAVAIYRIVQEALTNALRHGSAKHIDILLRLADDRLRVVVEDDGCGFQPEGAQDNGGTGLQGMQERAALLEGTLAVESHPGKGTTLVLDMPLASKVVS